MSETNMKRHVRAGIKEIEDTATRARETASDGANSVLESARACLSGFAGVAPVMPVFSSGQWASQAPDMYRELRSCDLMHLAGGGIIGHPDGIAAGVDSLREAWEAAMQGVELEAYARTHPALRKALSHFAGR